MSFVGLYTGLSGIRAAQTGIDVTSNNVANANTPGYTRQRVELRASHSYQSAMGRIGTGVTVESIARLRDAFLDDRFRSAIGEEAAAAARAESLATLEALSGEPDHGLSMRIGRLWTAAETWSNDPADPVARNQVLTELSSIAEGFRAASTAWGQLQRDTEDRRGSVVDVVNATLRTLDELNTRMANADPARVGPDLLDQRDLLLDDLARLTGATSRIQEDGSVSVMIGGQELLLIEDGPAQLEVDGDDLRIVDGAVLTGGIAGELGGLHTVLTEDLPRWQTELDEFAIAFHDAINAVNAEGALANGDQGEELLVFDPTDPAGSLRLAAGVTQASLAAGTYDGGDPPSPHDGSNARLFADLRTEPVSAGSGPDRSLETQLADLVVGLAGAVRSAQASATAAGNVATGAQLARAAEHGVSLDEEMVNLVRYQRALEAAARVMTTVDEALEVLVNRVGIVGR